MFQAFLIKYAEIAIKGKNRPIFEDALVKQIRRALKKVDGSFHVFKTQGRINIDCGEGYDYNNNYSYDYNYDNSYDYNYGYGGDDYNYGYDDSYYGW